MVDYVESASKLYFGMLIFDFHKNVEIHLLPSQPQPLRGGKAWPAGIEVPDLAINLYKGISRCSDHKSELVSPFL